MSEVTQQKFSEMAGVSKPAISKMVKSGKLVLNENKKIETNHPLSIAYLKKLDRRILNKKRNSQKVKIKPKKQVKIDKKVVKNEKNNEKDLSNNILDKSVCRDISDYGEKKHKEKLCKKVDYKKETQKSDTKKSNKNETKRDLEEKCISNDVKEKEYKKNVFKDVSTIKIDNLTPSDVVIEYQEIFKAVKLQEEALTKQLQRKEKEKALIDIEMGKYLFNSFLDQLKIELAILPGKEDPNLESLYKNGQNVKAQELLKRNFQMILEQIVLDQKKAMLAWKRT